MKRLWAMFLAAAMVFVVAACGSDGDQEMSGNSTEQTGTGQTSTEQTGTEQTGTEQTSTEQTGTEQTGTGQTDGNDTGALSILNAIWETYGEEEKFPAAGGDFSEENSVMDAPGNYGIEDAALLDQTFGMPEDAASKIDGAASLMHMMNANTFTCGAFHVGDPEEVSSVAEALRDNIQQRQWMCGFPDKLLIITVDDYVISAFGNEEFLDTFKSKTTAVYESAELLYEESIA